MWELLKLRVDVAAVPDMVAARLRSRSSQASTDSLPPEQCEL